MMDSINPRGFPPNGEDRTTTIRFGSVENDLVRVQLIKDQGAHAFVLTKEGVEELTQWLNERLGYIPYGSKLKRDVQPRHREACRAARDYFKSVASDLYERNQADTADVYHALARILDEVTDEPWSKAREWTHDLTPYDLKEES